MTEGTFSTGMNKIQAEKLKEIAKLLYEKGLIPKPNKYNVTKYSLIRVLEAFDVVNTGIIVPTMAINRGGVTNGRRRGEKAKKKS